MSGSLYENVILHISFYFLFYTREDIPLFLTFCPPQQMLWSLQYFAY